MAQRDEDFVPNITSGPLHLAAFWICDICGRQSLTSHRDFDRPVVDESFDPPAGWETGFDIPASERLAQLADCCVACPECVTSPNWSQYRDRVLERSRYIHVRLLNERLFNE